MSGTSHPNPWAEELTKPIEELNTYLANLPDFTEGSKRLDVRPVHLEHTKAGHGRWILNAGAVFSDDSATKMTGSWFLLREETMEKALARLGRDIYAAGGAWDMSKATISRVACAKQ